MHKNAYRVETVVCVWGLLPVSHSLYTALNLKRYTSNSRAAVSYTEHMRINLIVSSYSCKRKKKKDKIKIIMLSFLNFEKGSQNFRSSFDNK